MRLLVVMDPPAGINRLTDTTLVIVEEALARKHDVCVCTPGDLWLDGADVGVTYHHAVFPEGTLEPHGLPVGRASAALVHERFDLVLMRKDPPFDLDYYFTTQLLERLRDRVPVVNDPRGLRDANEKLYALRFPELVPPTRVARGVLALIEFMQTHGGEMIVKPLDGCGGSGVFYLHHSDRNVRAILEAATHCGTRWVMAQRYLPEAREGDKRILLLDGEVLGAVLRVPRADDHRGNLHVGGRPAHTTLTERDRDIVAQLAPALHSDGLFFVGIDVIGGFLTEVNVTSPTGVQEINRLDHGKLQTRIVDWLERRALS